MKDQIYDVLFLSSGNSARSIMAESILRKDGAGRFNAFSAGISPRSDIDPLTTRVLAESNYPTVGLTPKSWLDYARPDAPIMDFIFILADEAIGEKCPVWRGQPISANWNIENPVVVDSNEIEREKDFVKALQYLKRRITLFMALPLDRIDEMALGTKLPEVGWTEEMAKDHVTN